MIEMAENVKSNSEVAPTSKFLASEDTLKGRCRYDQADAVTTRNRKPNVFYFTLYRFLKRSTRPKESTILCSPV